MHSLAFNLTGLKSEQLMTAQHYREVERRIGVELIEGSLSRMDQVEEDLSNSLKRNPHCFV